MFKKVGKLYQHIKDYVFPVYCLGCQKEGEWICNDCFGNISLAGVFCCPVCHKETVAGICCEACQENSFLNSQMAATSYKEASLIGKVIQALKYQYAEDVEVVIKDIIKQFVDGRTGLFNEINFIVPVPLHRKRYVERGFNQAEKIAKILAGVLNKPMEDILQRTRHTGQQAKLKREERLENLKNAFEIKNDFAVKNKTILLVDDVFTTGSTMQECAKILKGGGVEKIMGFSVARG